MPLGYISSQEKEKILLNSVSVSNLLATFIKNTLKIYKTKQNISQGVVIFP